MSQIKSKVHKCVLKGKIIIKATKKEICYAMLCVLCVYLFVMQGSSETPLPWLVTEGRLQVFTTITVIMIMIMIIIIRIG